MGVGSVVIIVALAVARALHKHLIARSGPSGWSFAKVMDRELLKATFRDVPPRELEALSMFLAKLKAPRVKVRPHKRSSGGDQVLGYWIGDADYRDPNAIVHVFFHGGAYITLHPLAHLETFGALVDMTNATTRNKRPLALLTGWYTLAIDAPFPAQLNDALALYNHLLNDLKIDPSRIVIGGDSAGGNLTLALCLTIKERKLPQPAGIVLVCPWVTMSMNAPSYFRNRDTDLLDQTMLKHSIDKYFLRGQQDTPMTSPLNANLSELPKALVFAGDLEIFVDDIYAFVKKYRQVNGRDSVEYEEAPMQIHDYIVTSPPHTVKASLQRYVNFMLSSVPLCV